MASPRHADVLLVTGPVTKNMREALERTYRATPDPKWVVALGDCAADGGIFAGSYAVAGGVSNVVPVDLHIRGCPPAPATILKGLISLLEPANGRTMRARADALVIASEAKQSSPNRKPWIASSRSLSSGRPLRSGPVGSSQ